ncbi:hypothetical protein K3N28_16715 [Glycomyces sp. TRM65418]|uniref:hypothetical protein n=1 Tax=Glycomyces sp. TRM65418 TaxID=2867006 RepID=UPI001CE51858|nr:hypothetical protein [Glycomyces sp. TRM65418]MCC3764701.1 hypothetical protein [Glycomyces sp. TRM65418]QZD54360.1 hypothetical protein K3N28_16630 [Glycomyces sp. TRM65418]
MTASPITEATEAGEPDGRERLALPGTAGDPAAEHGLAWVPADACELPTAERPLRLAEFEDLFATAVTGLDRPAPTRLRMALSPDPAAAARAAELAVRETGCCGFFAFALTAVEHTLTLEVSVPQGRTEVLDGLAAQAETARAAA